MTEYQALAIIRKHLLAALVAYGYTCEVLAGRQPTRQLLKDSAVYFFPIGTSTKGAQGRSYKRTESDAIGHQERALLIKTIQIEAFLKRRPSDGNLYNASDLCEMVKMIVSSLPFIEALRAEGVGVSNITQIREPEFLNQSGDYEKNPSFDFDAAYTRTIKPKTPQLLGIVQEIKGI